MGIGGSKIEGYDAGGEDRPKISVIVPVFNDEWAIGPLFGKISRAARESNVLFETIFVNDGSTDGSANHLNQLAARSDSVRVLHLRRSFGITQALQAGFDHASGNYIVTISASLENDPNDIIPLIKKLEEGFDVCVGRRNAIKGRMLQRANPRGFVNKLISRISGLNLHDYECMLRAYKAPLIKNLRLYGHSERYIPIFLKWKGASIVELPVNNYPRTKNKTRRSFLRENIKTLLNLIMLKFMERYSERPLYLFGALGVLSLFSAFCTFLVMAYFKYIDGIAYIHTPLPIVASLFLLTGVLLIALGLISELQTRNFQSATTISLYDVRERIGFP